MKCSKTKRINAIKTYLICLSSYTNSIYRASNAKRKRHNTAFLYVGFYAGHIMEIQSSSGQIVGNTSSKFCHHLNYYFPPLCIWYMSMFLKLRHINAWLQATISPEKISNNFVTVFLLLLLLRLFLVRFSLVTLSSHSVFRITTSQILCLFQLTGRQILYCGCMFLRILYIILQRMSHKR